MQMQMDVLEHRPFSVQSNGRIPSRGHLLLRTQAPFHPYVPRYGHTHIYILYLH